MGCVFENEMVAIKKNRFKISVVKHYLLAYFQYFPCYEHGHTIHLVATVTHTKHFNFNLSGLIQAIHAWISLYSTLSQE